MEKDNIIYDGETIIGTLENIETFFRQEMAYQLQDGDLDFEELQYNFKNIFNIILEIEKKEQDIIAKEKVYGEKCLFEIKECSMGGFTYNIYKQVK